MEPVLGSCVSASLQSLAISFYLEAVLLEDSYFS